ncbi:MFS general substrate transporter [Mycena leptocephala]|nr:MFS general substrate transporter [Mycena leptocephala]
MPYSIYTLREKWCIPAVLNIYFPVIPTLSQVFHQPIELINLTVAPMFWGTLADSWGRRPMFIFCLLLLSASCAGLALIPTRDYWLLLFLRGFQAAGSASTFVLGAAVISDISQPRTAGSAIGPALGGVLADKLGWRSIFWFLCIASSACAVVLILLLPETLRSMVGNGSIAPRAAIISRPILPLIGGQTPRRHPHHSHGSLFYGVMASISTLFHATYPALNQTQIGLCFLSMTIESDSFLFEQVLIQVSLFRRRLIVFTLYVAVCVAYGWCIARKVNIAGPLVLLIGVGFFHRVIMDSTQMVSLDFVSSEKTSSIMAQDNFVQCVLSAAMVAVIQLALSTLGPGWTYVLFAGICAIVSLPLMYVLPRYSGSTMRGETGTIDHQTVHRIPTDVGLPESFAEMGTTTAGLPLSGIGPSKKADDAPNTALI